MFELCTPRIKTVVRHQHERLVLHGARDLRTLQELDPATEAMRYGWDIARTFGNLRTLPEVVAAARSLDPLQQEGFVVRDSRFRWRVKIKSPQYVALMHLNGGGGGSASKQTVTQRHLLQIVIANEADEFMSYFPELTELYARVKAAYDRFIELFQSQQQTAEQLTKKQAALLQRLRERSSASGALEMNARELLATHSNADELYDLVKPFIAENVASMTMTTTASSPISNKRLSAKETKDARRRALVAGADTAAVDVVNSKHEEERQ
jgi:hypothetical protein